MSLGMKLLITNSFKIYCVCSSQDNLHITHNNFKILHSLQVRNLNFLQTQRLLIPVESVNDCVVHHVTVKVLLRLARVQQSSSIERSSKCKVKVFEQINLLQRYKYLWKELHLIQTIKFFSIIEVFYEKDQLLCIYSASYPFLPLFLCNNLLNLFCIIMNFMI